jgi:two-component system response regulator FixJ
MPGMDGLELQRRLKQRGNTMPVIVITGHGDVPLAVTAMKEGAVDFIEKPFDDSTMINAVRSALDRQQQEVARSGAATATMQRLESLSERERQVLQGLIDGQANKMIAQNLSISPRTVEIYRANLMTKMQASSLSELVRMAIMAGIVGDGAAG